MFICSSCHTTTPKWAGKCPHCGEWNTLVESKTDNRKGKIQGGKMLETQKLTNNESSNKEDRIASSSNELDGVLGGGLSPGSLVLLS